MALRFVSTRSGDSVVEFADAVLRGIADDGGLFMPGKIPDIGEDWRSMPDFSSMARLVLSRWLAGVDSDPDVDTVVSRALDFPVPVVRLSGGEWEEVLVVELFHGPTLSFKDFGARCMAGFMMRALDASEEKTILVATSGDTGSAVADGFAGLDGISVVLLYPRGQVSPTQERQLIVSRPGVSTFAVDGTFDDCQRMVKEVFARNGEGGRFTSANSINVGRLLPQMTYYYWAASKVEPREFRCCVPSGNLGNITAGTLAHLAGIRAARYVAAHNANDFLARFLESGAEDYRPSVRTLSNAMDVGEPSNYERLRHLMDAESLRRFMWATSVSDKSTSAAIRRVFDLTGYVADPHTAVAFEAVARYRRSTGDVSPIAIMSTAHPAKFPETVSAALGFSPDVPQRLADYWNRDTRSRTIGPDVDALLSALE